jgi:glycerol-3-phosphate dehydrogenase
MTQVPEFSYRTRASNLDALSREQFDVLVVGGGITGAGIARDASLRGLRVALVERRDFAVGTSSRSSKLIHGGVRYLQQGDVGLVMEAANERRVLRSLAPHLARPTPLIVPVHGRAGYAKLSAGLWTFDRMARVSKDERNQMLSREETVQREPLLREDHLYGAGMYYEYLTDDARLVIENIKSAASLGAVVATYAEVSGFVKDGGRLDAAMVRDVVSDAQFPVRAKVIVNAAGPWVDTVRLLQADCERPRLHLTKGIHVVLRRERLDVSRIVIMDAPDHRPVFVVPRGTVVYLGTTDTDYAGRYDDPPITVDDVTYLLEAANATFAIDPLGLDDVVGAWAGLRPLLHQDGKKPAEISRKDEIMIGPTGLISIAGGKLTTYRKMAERVIDLVADQLSARGERLPVKRGESDRRVLSGGETGEEVADFAARVKRRWPHVAADIVERVVSVYGSNGERMVEAMAADPTLAQRCARGAALSHGEIAYAVRAEMALTLEDLLERRARLFLWDPNNGLPVAAEAARLMGTLLGWDAARIDTEFAGYTRRVRDARDFSPRRATAPASRVAYA